MTRNTVDYIHNRAMEDLEARKLDIESNKLSETIRHNLSDESIRSAANDIKRLADAELDSRERDKLAETVRNNIANLNETHQWHLTQEEMAKLDRDIKSLQLAETSRANDIAEKKLQIDLQSSMLRGTVSSLITSIPKLGLGAAAAGALTSKLKTLQDVIRSSKNRDEINEMIKDLSRELHKDDPKLAATFGSMLAKAAKALGITGLLTGVATNVTSSGSRDVNEWRYARNAGKSLSDLEKEGYFKNKHNQDEDEIPEEVQVGGKTYKYSDYKGEKTNEKLIGEGKNVKTSGVYDPRSSQSNQQTFGKTSRERSADDAGSYKKSQVIDTRSSRPSVGPGFS